MALGSLIVYIVSYYKKGLMFDELTADSFYPILPTSIIFATTLFPVSNKLVDFFVGKSKPVILIVSFFGLSLQYSCAFVKYNPYTFYFVFSTGFGLLKMVT